MVRSVGTIYHTTTSWTHLFRAILFFVRRYVHLFVLYYVYPDICRIHADTFGSIRF